MRTRQRGVAIVEFALVLPFLLVLTFITTEFGRALYQYNILTKSVRDASRYLSTQLPGTNAQQARNLIVYGNMAGTGTPLALGLTTSHVPDPVWQTEAGTPPINTVTVRITGYAFRPLVPSVFGLPLAPNGLITYSDITATMRAHANPS